ncbi:hypothetical protein CIT31_24570 [Mesorhizobium wenxiniae]|uniref:Uncharacterized protein n=2 Tax=Mesorhizobium wenxiniae TaxID=2014805 RepID=A0A271KBV9_9HYPH|nr:hypothetical protein CIT31_24570 [Mesorhizobium wenxiniae]
MKKIIHKLAVAPMMDGADSHCLYNDVHTPCTRVCALLCFCFETPRQARKQGKDWSVGDDDLAYIDEILAALGIVDIAFRNTG